MKTIHSEIGQKEINLSKAKILAVKELQNKLGVYINTKDVTFQHIHITPNGYVFTVSNGTIALDVWVETQTTEYVQYPLAYSGQPIKYTTKRNYTVWSCVA